MTEIFSTFYKILADFDYFALLALTFLAAALMAGGIFFLVTQRNYIRERLSKFIPTQKPIASKKNGLVEEEEDKRLVTKISAPLSTVVAPAEETARKKMRLKLIRAGFRSKSAYRNYLAIKFLCSLIFPLGFFFTAFFYKLSLQAILTGFILALIGFFLPSLFIGYFTYKRKLEISRALPDALDLMVICIESGLGLDMTFKRVGEEIRPISKELSDEFFLTNMEIRAGKPRNESFRNMYLRTGVQEVNNLMTILIQANRFGTSIAKALRVHADAMRVKRRQIAEEKAAQTTVKLVFPLIFFIFPALMIVIAGPAAIRIFKTLFPAITGQG